MPQKRPKDSHQSTVYLLHIRTPLPVFLPEEDEFQFRAATSYEINRIAQLFPSKKAQGKDKLHTAVVKDALQAIFPILTEIINSSFLRPVFPSPWKESEIVPIPKDGGDPEIANENQPVSLLPAHSKICERVALNQFHRICKKEKLSQ